MADVTVIIILLLIWLWFRLARHHSLIIHLDAEMGKKCDI
jgi:hypothetical protein